MIKKENIFKSLKIYFFIEEKLQKFTSQMFNFNFCLVMTNYSTKKCEESKENIFKEVNSESKNIMRRENRRFEIVF